ncbi:MAG: response regulator [Scytonema sp. PMC 1069.18]|nr:response regulator [Scytonema sp. PMC 1069.18]MEC4885331.1 response regulator [Scytonema sp. PMC 1070.18]
MRYQAGELRNLLDDLLSQGASGSIYIKANLHPEKKTRSRIAIINRGGIVYGGISLPSNQEFARRLGVKLKHTWADTAVKYVAQKLQNSSSYRELLEHMIRIRVFKWEEIETAIRVQVVQVLEQTLLYPGELEFDANTQIDLCYGTDGHGFNWYKLLQEVSDRQREWAALTPFVPSMEATPRLITSLREVTDKDAKQHLQSWVDGRRSLIEISEQSDKDSLELAKCYATWVKSNWVAFGEEAPFIQPRTQKTEIFPAEQHIEEQRPIILSVDDSPLVQTLIKRALSQHYQVLSANNATDALRLMNVNQIALLLLDVTMPDIDGLEFCRTVRSIPKFRKMPIIMVTAKDKFSDKLRGQIAGSTHYITKPFEPKNLLEIVNQHITQRKPSTNNTPANTTFPRSRIHNS